MKFPRHVKIAVLPVRNIIQLNKTVKSNIKITGGLEGEFIRTLAATLGFTYELHIPTDDQWGTIKNGEWNGVVGMVNRCEVDLGMAHLTVTDERKQAGNFIPYSSDASTFERLLRLNTVPNSFFYIDPFKFNVWLTLISLMLLYAFSLSLLHKKLNYLSLFYKLVGCVLKQSSNFKDNGIKERYLLAFWYILSLFINLAYSAVLLSFMTVPAKEKGITTFHELSNAVAGGYFKCYAMKGSADIDILKESNNTSLQYLGQMIEDNSWMKDLNSLTKTIEPNIAVLGYRVRIEFDILTEPVRTKYVFKEDIGKFDIGIVTCKKFCCANVLEEIIQKFKYAGIFSKIYEIETFKIKLSRSREKIVMKESKINLTISHFYGAFLLLCAGYTISIIFLLIEIIVFYLGKPASGQ